MKIGRIIGKIITKIKPSFRPLSRRWRRRFFRGLIIGLLAFVLLAAGLFAWYSRELPTPGKIKKRQMIQSTQILARDGTLLYDAHGDIKRQVIDNQDIPQYVKQATVAVEDKNFYRHFGLDFKGVTRAAIRNLTGGLLGKGNIEGGSTITQQYVKNALLSPKKTLSRKIKELILSIEIEIMYSKDQILALYLNEIPYGSSNYGIESASQTYFNKKAKDLTLAEATALAALPRAPTFYSPYGQHKDRLLTRKNYVLDQMVAMGYLNKEQAEAAKKEELKFARRQENIKAPHFVMYVREMLVDKYGEKMVAEGGLKVYTTIDLKYQAAAEEAITEIGAKNIKRYGANNAALVSLDPKTGEILAMVGSIDYFDMENDGNVNVTIANRQPGSSFKPIVYATAFKDKYNPAYPLFDVSTDFGNYTPQNYNGQTNGLLTMRQALSNSLNIPAVKTLYLAGLKESLQTAHDMGITTLNQPERYGLSLVLGGGEVKPLDMATAFGVFANEGKLFPTHGILKIEDSKGKIIDEPAKNLKAKTALDPQIAYQIANILSDNDSRSMIFGSRSALYFPDRTVAAKTGTTTEFRDAWTVGFTPSLSTAVWVGNNDNTPMAAHADGVVAAAPIFHKYIQEALKDKPNEDFNRPKEIKEITVDKLSNKLPNDNSPADQRVTDIFASWQIPDSQDDVHLKIKICKADGKKAPAGTLEQLVEEIVYYNIHSEVPGKSNWEGPVRAWVAGQGWDKLPPTEESPHCNEGVQPTVIITSPGANQSLIGNFLIVATASSDKYAIKKVEFYIDNVSIGVSESSPYQLSYNSKNLTLGEHNLEAAATNELGVMAKVAIKFIASRDTTPPGKVSRVAIVPSANRLSITWTNPTDSDLAKIRFYLSTASGLLGYKYDTEFAAIPGANGVAALTNLANNTTYYLTIRTVDGEGNENNNTTQYSGTPAP